MKRLRNVNDRVRAHIDERAWITTKYRVTAHTWTRAGVYVYDQVRVSGWRGLEGIRHRVARHAVRMRWSFHL